MGTDNPIAMVLLMVFCLFGIATTNKGTPFTVENNYLSSFLQFDFTISKYLVNIDYHQFFYGNSSINKPSNHI